MKIREEDAAKIVEKGLNQFQWDKEKRNKATEFLEEKYNFPSGRFADYYTQRLPVGDLAKSHRDILFYLASAIDLVDKQAKAVDQIFTPMEIDGFSKAKFQTLKANFPIRIKCVRVDEDQWIGVTDVHFLMALRASQLINYNTNAQRVVQRLISHGNETYRISINKKAVSEIRGSFEDGQYIPNTITLNIPQPEKPGDPTPDFYYDEKNCELVIRLIDHFDISDGYHRYIAMAQIYDNDETFNYPMELRITNFSEGKAREMIWQEDQKTRMSKVDSDSMTTRFPVNRIVDRLNTDQTSNWSHCISRKDGIVDYGQLAEVINFYYIKGKRVPKKEEQKFVLETVMKIEPGLNTVIMLIPDLLEKVDFKDLMIIFYCLTHYENSEVVEKVKKGRANKDKLSKRFATQIPTKVMVKEIDKIMEA